MLMEMESYSKYEFVLCKYIMRFLKYINMVFNNNIWNGDVFK